MLSHQSLACNSGRWSFSPSAASDRLPTRRTHPQAGQKTDAHRSSNIHESDVAPVNGVPPEHVPVDMPSHSMDAVEMTEVCDKQADK